MRQKKKKTLFNSVSVDVFGFLRVNDKVQFIVLLKKAFVAWKSRTGNFCMQRQKRNQVSFFILTAKEGILRMKKIMSILLALGMAASVAFSAVGCGVTPPPAVSSSEAEESSEAPEEESSQEPESSEESSEPEESSEEPEESSEPESSQEESSSTTITGKFNSIEEYVNSDLLQNQLKGMLDSYKDAGIDIKLVGEGNKLIYLCTLSDEYASIDGMAETLEEGLDDQASTYESIASTLKLAVNVEDPVVEVRYQTESGKVLCSREYSAK